MSRVKLSRRGWLAAAVGVGAAAGGAGLAWRSAQRQQQALSAAETRFWQQQFLQVDGTVLPMAGYRGRLLLVNFWATWCPPCVEELPLLSRFFTQNETKNWQVLGLAVDQQAPVRRFLAQTPVSFPVALAGFEGVALSQSLGNPSGGLPFTTIFSPVGTVLYRKLGKLTTDDLQAVGQMQG